MYSTYINQEQNKQKQKNFNKQQQILKLQHLSMQKSMMKEYYLAFPNTNTYLNILDVISEIKSLKIQIERR